MPSLQIKSTSLSPSWTCIWSRGSKQWLMRSSKWTSTLTNESSCYRGRKRSGNALTRSSTQSSGTSPCSNLSYQMISTISRLKSFRSRLMNWSRLAVVAVEEAAVARQTSLIGIWKSWRNRRRSSKENMRSARRTRVWSRSSLRRSSLSVSRTSRRTTLFT